jgi:putative ABC transport system permease protein
MTYLESIRIAMRALRANGLRTLLTMLGIIIGVASVITMVAMGEGAHTRVAEQIRTLGANLLMVVPGTAREGGARLKLGSRHTLTQADAAAIRREVPVVDVAAPAVREMAQVVHGNRNWNTNVTGTEPDYFIAREWPIASGQPFTRKDVSGGAKVAVLGASVAKALFHKTDPLGRLIRIADVPFTVVGVLSAKGPSGTGRDQDDVIFIPISTAKLRLMGGAHEINRDAVAYILIKIANARGIDSAERQIAALLRQRHRLSPDAEDDFEVRNPAAAMAAQRVAAQTLTFLLAAVASVSLIVGGISIMNIMLVSVSERTREIGLRLAVGARRRDIRNQFLLEAVTLCILGGLLGILLGVGAAAAVAEMADWPVFIGPEALVLAAGFAAAVGVFFGFYPALKASRLDPIEALRYE